MMATALTPTMRPIKFIFLDIPAGVAVDETIELTKPFHDLMALLSRMSGSVYKQIKGLGRPYAMTESGLNLSDGCWWYRIVKITSTQPQEAAQTIPLHIKGDWCRLATLFAYDYMRDNELAAGLPLDEGWVEIQHDLQKKRDESTAAKARQQDKDWRSSMGHTQESPQDDSASMEPTSVSASLTNASHTSLQSVGAEDAVKNSVTLHKHAKSDSVGSCTSTEQVKQLLEEYQAQAHPLVIEWPRPPRCTLIHLNEEHVAEDAESRNHHPVPFAAFEKGEEYAHGLPSYTPRPGPFSAQIGRPPSMEYCAYEIRNDIEYHPESPTLEEACIRPAESQALHYERYHGNNAPRSKAPAANLEPLRTSISLPDQNMRYDMGSSLLEPAPYPMKSAPADMQTLAQVPWTRMTCTVGIQQPGQRYSSQESYRSQSSGNAPYQAASYFGSGSCGWGGQQSGYAYQSQSSLRSSSSPTRLHRYHVPPLSPFANLSAVRHPSFPPPPQEVVQENTSPGPSNYRYGELGSGSFPIGLQVNFDAMKESEVLGMTTQSEPYYASYHPSPAPSRQSTPNQYSRSKSAAQQTSGSYPPSRTASRQSSRVLLPGFSDSFYGTDAPTFATANDFTQSFDILTRELGPTWPHHGSGSGSDPALEANHRLLVQSQTKYANDNTMAPGPATGPTRGRKTYPMLLASHGQSQNQRTRISPKPGKQPFSGQFSPPKPRMKGKHAANVLDRYNRGGLSQNRAPKSATTGGFMEPSSLGPPSLSIDVSKEVSEGYQCPKVALPTYQQAEPPRKDSSDQISSSAGPTSTASNFSDDFILKDSGTSKKKVKAKAAGVKKAKRGATKETDAVKKANGEDIMKNARDAADARAARVKRRSSGKIEAEAGAAVESHSLMNEG